MEPKSKGTVEIGRIGGVPVYLHWSFWLGGIFGGVFFSAYVGHKVVQTLYLCVGYMGLVTIHELGHFAAARAMRLRVFAVWFTGLGGWCETEMPATWLSAALVCGGGVIAQLALFVIVAGFVVIYGTPQGPLMSCVVLIGTFANLLLLVCNLVPSRSATDKAYSDGYVLWQILRSRRIPSLY